MRVLRRAPVKRLGYRVLCMRTSELVQRLQAARQSLALPQALAKLDRYDLLILDDISYVRKDQAETSVRFEPIAERYERRGIIVTANQPFPGWSNVFPDPGMTVTAIDRLVHHSTIFELHKVESYRGKHAARDQKLQDRRAVAVAGASGRGWVLRAVAIRRCAWPAAGSGSAGRRGARGVATRKAGSAATCRRRIPPATDPARPCRDSTAPGIGTSREAAGSCRAAGATGSGARSVGGLLARHAGSRDRVSPGRQGYVVSAAANGR